MEKTKEKIVLIDGNAIIHRAYHALPPLTTKKGELVNAVFGFSSILLKVISELKPEYLIATFDLKAPTFRHLEYKEYKATRVKAPDDLYNQIDRVKEVVKAFNIPIFEKEGFEADDVIGTLAKKIKGENQETYIVTGDLDTLQLVNEHTLVYALKKGMSDTTVYDEKAVTLRFGLTPGQMIEYKGLRGDASDNIPGVRGIGEKTAVELLKKYQTIDNVYKNIDNISGALQKKLKEGEKNAYLSRKLATICLDVPIELELEKAILREFDREKVIKLFQELGFFSLIKRIPESKDTATLLNKIKLKITEIDQKTLTSFGEMVKKSDFISLQLQASNKIIFATGENRLWSIDLSKISLISEIITSITKVGYDFKRMFVQSPQLEETLGKNIFDLMLAVYVLDPGRAFNLEKVMEEYLGLVIAESSLKGQMGLKLGDGQKNESNEKELQWVTHFGDLYLILKKKLETISGEQKSERNVKTVFFDLEMPLIDILASMERWGVRVDNKKLEEIGKALTVHIGELEKNIHTLAGQEFNINSPKQVADILFKKLKLPTENIKKLKTGFSTASGELKKLLAKHPIVRKIDEYREFFKLKTTYLDTLPELSDQSGRIHTQFNQAVTATGRLSSSEPNLQNIPVKTDWGKKIRSAFVASPGWKLVSVDYSQIDLRVMAHLSRDKKMMEAFENNEDIHRLTASEVNKIKAEEVTDDMRNRAKALNFGIIYGISAFGFSEGSGISQEEAQKFIKTYFERFPGVKKYMEEMKNFSRKHLFAETELGRRRYLPEIASNNMMLRRAAERMAINMPVQGLTADIMKLAMIKTNKAFSENKNIRMILQIHDEIIWEVKAEEAIKMAQKAKDIMEKAYELRVPLVAEAHIGDNWGET